ncbi:mannose-P-dolichol utilization defect 1 protein [Heliocybe sulcata]|uniref:Mannose-P-dolichol utilization defect 1 protein homolog n=1 Tax=Heliocybe sulcata TaxID=5364 RepID=A0A5C3MV96_9AGAM|nr:mannose-P-dolichol utilization defect 1 protein [Heliocybe sulcata]
MKVPQLLLILRAHSARGLSLPSYILETLAYAITLAYSFRNAFPFSTYGENLFLTLQNAIITLLILYYRPSLSSSRQSNKTSQLLTASFITFASGLALYLVPSDALSLLQLSTLPLSLFSKLPQITQNHRAQSTGQLSAFAVFSQIAGCLARLFTTATEVGDILVTAGFALALLLNCVLGAQLWMYWGKDARETNGQIPVSQKEKSTWPKEREASVEVSVPPQTPPARYASPAPSGRKWARKID